MLYQNVLEKKGGCSINAFSRTNLKRGKRKKGKEEVGRRKGKLKLKLSLCRLLEIVF